MADERDDEVMEAVFSALCSHGYAAVTMQDIADESSLSKGTLHYHYDTKRELLLAFLAHLYQRFEARLDAAEADAGEDHLERAEAVIEAAIQPPEKPDLREFRTAVLEIKAQAPFEPSYREHLAAFDATVSERIERIVQEGLDAGRFDPDTDPAEVASFVVTVINGAHTRSVATDYPVEDARTALLEYPSDHVREPEATR
jgi:AcrR family transcriptional regulator